MLPSVPTQAVGTNVDILVAVSVKAAILALWLASYFRLSSRTHSYPATRSTIARRDSSNENVPVMRHWRKTMQRFFDDHVKIIYLDQGQFGWIAVNG